jgi:arabinogalactan oligomer / maltooligosaccharide transport system permease protein
MKIHRWLPLLLPLLFACREVDERLKVTLWHQMVPAERAILSELIAEFEATRPDIEVRALYKETEELRSGFQAAALAGAGPELVYGPSDAIGPFQTMGIVQDMSPWFGPEEQEAFVEGTLTRLPGREPEQAEHLELLQVGDRVGNHLALVCNGNYLEEGPATDEDLVRLALANTIDLDGDGRIDRYGIAWNFTEPFFVIPFLTGHGGWVFDREDPGQTTPALDDPAAVAAYRFVLALRDEHRVMPANTDYEGADGLFKEGRAAMIINGDWSWGDYLSRPELKAFVAPLPVVTATGLPMGPMVATKGYTLNRNTAGPEAEAAMALVAHLVSESSQRRFMAELKTLPSRRALLDDPLLTEDPTLRASAIQMRNGHAMPVVAELRAIWDSMRPHYQALLGGSVSPEEAAQRMQVEAVDKIRRMNQSLEPSAFATVFKVLLAAALVWMLWWQRGSVGEFLRSWRRYRLAYLFVVPSFLVIAVTIVFPFFYNIVLSFSNMSLRHFQDWQVIGLQNYIQVFGEGIFWSVLLKTVIWTVVNVGFHLVIGVLLAVTLNGPVLGRSVYRVLLIIPWAVPAYITALTWRGMFDFEYGAVNLIGSQIFNLPMVNWLGDPLAAFIACITTNVWLGFPFMMVIALGGLQAIPQELYEAARVDGASRWTQFRRITMPLLKPVMLPAVTLGTVWTFNQLNVMWLVSNGGEPSDKTHILVSYVYKAVFNLYQYGYGAALSMVIFFILLAFSILFLKRTKATEAVY